MQIHRKTTGAHMRFDKVRARDQIYDRYIRKNVSVLSFIIDDTIRLPLL